MKNSIILLITILTIHFGVFSQNEVLRIRIINSTQNDECVIRFKSGSSFGFDNNYDAYKLLSSNVPQIYTQLPDGTQLSINSVPEITSDYDFSVCLKIYTNGTYNINSSGMTDFSSNYGMFLIDQITNTKKNIRVDSLYTITALTTQAATRFLLRFSMRPANPTIFSATPVVVQQLNLSATADANNDSVVLVYNSNGVFTTPVDGISAGSVNSSFAGGTVLYKGPAASIPNHTGLSYNQHLYYKAFSFNYMYMYSTGITANATTFRQTISCDTSSLNFGDQLKNTTSSSLSFSISGSHLTSAIKLFPSSHFKISLNGGINFNSADSLVLTPVSGNVNSTNIYVEFTPSSNGVFSEKIVCVSQGADTLRKNVTGNGINGPRPCYISLLLQGLYNSNTGMMNEALDGNTSQPKWGSGIADKIDISLIQENPPYNIVYQVTNVILYTNGNAIITVPVIDNGNYFISISNRNHLETWSANSIPFSGDTIRYNFYSNAFQAYQNFGSFTPQIQVSENKFAFYLGDLNRSGYVDLDDFSLFEPDLTSGATGFLNSDFNGSGYVDLDDFSLFEPSLMLGLTSQLPY